jgi:hypothetical protein
LSFINSVLMTLARSPGCSCRCHDPLEVRLGVVIREVEFLQFACGRADRDRIVDDHDRHFGVVLADELDDVVHLEEGFLKGLRRVPDDLVYVEVRRLLDPLGIGGVLAVEEDRVAAELLAAEQQVGRPQRLRRGARTVKFRDTTTGETAVDKLAAGDEIERQVSSVDEILRRLHLTQQVRRSSALQASERCLPATSLLFFILLCHFTCSCACKIGALP